MADEQDRDHGEGDQSRRKKSYQTPCLVQYGSVATLTAGGSINQVEALMSNGMCNMGISMRVNPACP